MSHEALIPISPRHALGTGGDLPGPGLDQIGTRRQRADADQIEVLELPVIAFVLAQPELPQLDLGPEWKAVEAVEQIVIGQAQGVIGRTPAACAALEWGPSRHGKDVAVPAMVIPIHTHSDD